MCMKETERLFAETHLVTHYRSRSSRRPRTRRILLLTLIPEAGDVAIDLTLWALKHVPRSVEQKG